jgi:hypothetical protein
MTPLLMGRDPAKKITGVATGRHEGEIRVVLLIDNGLPLIIESTGLSQDQAELLAGAYFEGLQASEGLTAETIHALLDDPEAVAALESPTELNSVNRELFRRGALGGLRLAAAGYWVDTEDSNVGATLH